MPLPDLTNLQFLVLCLLLDRELEGRDLRAFMAEEGATMGRPAFYRLMSRLEDAKFVKGDYEKREIDGDVVRVRKYKITASGSRARHAMLDFVSSAAKTRLRFQGA